MGTTMGPSEPPPTPRDLQQPSPPPPPPPPPTDPAGGPAVAGWYPDPWGSAALRYWNGSTWTGHTHQPTPTSPSASRSVDPAAGAVGRRGLRVLSGWLQGLLWACAVAGALVAVSGIVATIVSQAFFDGTATLAELVEAEDAMLGMSGLFGLAFLVAAVLWVVWLFRTHRQVQAVTGWAGRHGRGWTIGSWIVPIANLWIPKQVHDDLHRATGREEEDRGGRVPALLHWWWALWIISNLLAIASNGTPDGTQDASALIGYYVLNALWGLSEVAVGVVAVFVVRHLGARTDATAATAGLPAG